MISVRKSKGRKSFFLLDFFIPDMATLGAPLATDTVVPPGRSASNRNWKEANAKASKRVQSKTLHAGYHKRAQKERTIKQMKTIEKEMKDEKAVQVEVPFIFVYCLKLVLAHPVGC